MSSLLEEWTPAVARALEAHCAGVRQTAPRRWNAGIAGDEGVILQAHLTQAWLLLDAPLPAAPATSPLTRRNLLAANAVLPANLRFCTDGMDARLRLRAEVPVLEDIEIASRLERICAGIAAAAAWLTAGAVGTPQATRPPAGGGQQSPPHELNLSQLCGESGWPHTVRDEHSVVVELDCGSSFKQATLTRGVGGWLATVALLTQMPPAGPCATAVERFLLGLSGTVRTIAASVSESGAELRVGGEQAPVGDELAHAFAALSVAWRRGGREVEVLARDERIARLYDALRSEPLDTRLAQHTT